MPKFSFEEPKKGSTTLLEKPPTKEVKPKESAELKEVDGKIKAGTYVKKYRHILRESREMDEKEALEDERFQDARQNIVGFYLAKKPADFFEEKPEDFDPDKDDPVKYPLLGPSPHSPNDFESLVEAQRGITGPMVTSFLKDKWESWQIELIIERSEVIGQVEERWNAFSFKDIVKLVNKEKLSANLAIDVLEEWEKNSKFHEMDDSELALLLRLRKKKFFEDEEDDQKAHERLDEFIERYKQYLKKFCEMAKDEEYFDSQHPLQLLKITTNFDDLSETIFALQHLEASDLEETEQKGQVVNMALKVIRKIDKTTPRFNQLIKKPEDYIQSFSDAVENFKSLREIEKQTIDKTRTSPISKELQRVIERYQSQLRDYFEYNHKIIMSDKITTIDRPPPELDKAYYALIDLRDKK